MFLRLFIGYLFACTASCINVGLIEMGVPPEIIKIRRFPHFPDPKSFGNAFI